MMESLWMIGVVPALAAIIAAVLVLVLFMVKALWAWLVPDLFPAAVEQGLVARSISWLAAFKIALFAALLTGIRAGFTYKP